MRLACAAALLAVGALSTALAQGTNRDVWLAAVARHQPGAWDSAAMAVSAWSSGQLDAILRSLPLGRGRPADMNQTLIRGAMLHADVAMRAPDGHVRPVSPFGSPARRVLLDDDGRYAGARMESPDWAFARKLLDALEPAPATHDIVRLWYRATLAWMAGERQVAQALAHQRRGSELFPDDPQIHFARGWINETFAAPGTQAVVAALRDAPPSLRSVTIRQTADVPPVAEALARAEDGYAAALAADPHFTEARIHRARIVLLRGRPAEAVDDLRRALGEAREPMLAYLALLFLGGALEGSGNHAGARAAYAEAAALFPLAQSARLGLSRAASRAGDRAAALRHVQALLDISADDQRRGDPWWIYPAGLGRHADTLLADLHAAISP